MARYAIVNTSTGSVENVIEYAATPATPPPGFGGNYIAVQSDAAGPGWGYANSAFTNPNPPAPAPVPSCQLWQLQAVMTAAQWTAAQNAVNALDNPAVSAFWAHGTNVIPASSTTLLALGEAIGLTADQITVLVQQAAAVAIP